MTTLRNKTRTGVLGIAISMLLFLFPLAPQKANAQVGINISFQTFYDNLSPYGTWFNDPQYGYVWAPNAGPDFRPYYTNGYWVNTNYGNMWMSDYPWGWAAFHYGRWTYSSMYGWLWIPGNEWGPAWVSWREGGGYYGWAPMGPGVSINISFGSNYYVPSSYWTFIPYNHLYTPSFHRYYTPGRTTVIYNNTTIINNTYINNNSTYVTGPRRSSVVSRTGQSVRTYQVGTSNTAGRSSVSGDRVSVYRPAVRRESVDGGTSRPANVRTTPAAVVPRTAEAQPVNNRATTTPAQRTTTNSNVRATATPNTSRNATTQPATGNTGTTTSTTPRAIAPPTNTRTNNRQATPSSAAPGRTVAPQPSTRISSPQVSPSVQRSTPAAPTPTRAIRTTPPAAPKPQPSPQRSVQPASGVRSSSSNTSVQRSSTPAPARNNAPSRSVPASNTRVIRR